MELTKLQVAMLSPVKRQVYLRRKERARQSMLERATVIPCWIPMIGAMFWVPQYRMTQIQEAYAKLEGSCASYKARLEAEHKGES